nr:MAG TPA: C2H2 type zinc-finger protein [Caudoviricetes sp.]
MASRGNQPKTHICPYCGKAFQPLGIASHRAACRRKKEKEKTESGGFPADK